MKSNQLYICLLMAISSVSAWANNSIDDSANIQERLQQQSSAKARAKEQQTIADTTPQAPEAGEYLSLPQALYLFVQRENWKKVRELLPRYEQSTTPDQTLILYAKAKLAWADGHFNQSIQQLKTIVQNHPDFILGRLELGKALFLDKQNQLALAQFNTVKQTIDPNNPKQHGVYLTIQAFEKALKQREAWYGLVNLGYIHDSNINQSSNIKECTTHIVGVIQFNTCRQTPAPIVANGLHYEANINRRLSLYGRHGLAINALLFGDIYHNNQQYNQRYLGVDIGYSFQTAKQEWTLSPSISRNWLGTEVHHDSYGISTSWQYNATAQTSINVSASYLYQNYPHEYLQDSYNGARTRLAFNLWHNLSDSMAISAGLSTAYQNTHDKTNAYKDNQLRIAMYKNFSLANVMFQASFNRRQYDKMNATLSATRHDTTQHYLATLKFPQWQLWGIYPNLFVEHIVNKSNINWLYSYHNTQLGIRLEKTW